jgi:C-terminal processing protease CtpA/Prc
LCINGLPTRLLGLVTTVGLLVPPGLAQHFSSLDRERAQVMLQNVASDVRQHYYDPKLHGVDWDARVREAKDKIAKATSMDTATLEIGAALETLDDFHTAFVPPRYPIREDYGWRFQAIGERCYVTQVRPQSDAGMKGLKPGDEVLAINGFTPTRSSLQRIEYVLNVLLPQSSLRVDLRDRSGELRRIDAMAKVRQTQVVTDLANENGRDVWGLILDLEEKGHLRRARYEEIGTDLMILKMPALHGTDELYVQEKIDKARKHSALIMDLRGNSGGASATLEYLALLAGLRDNPQGPTALLQYFLGGMFERDVKIADRVTREATTPLVAKSNHHHVFTGELIVLVDSESSSAAELFARVIQIEKRGTVLGDRTSGSVMEAKYYDHRTGINPIIFYGALVSDADLTMADGKSLEHVGVTPDETILPSAADLANGRDPVLARAAQLAGVELSPEKAAQLFPFEWPKN